MARHCFFLFSVINVIVYIIKKKMESIKIYETNELLSYLIVLSIIENIGT